MSIRAGDMMTSPAISVLEETGVGEIAALLMTKHISAVPVCRSDGTLAGIVSEGDLLRPFRESVRERRDWWLGMLSEGEKLSQDYLDYVRRDTHTAQDIMAKFVITADESATLPELAETMLKHAVKRIPILRDGRLVGIVSRADLIAAIAREPALAS